MIFFITFLRALAAGLITNAHYTGVYPTDLIANGGLIGDILFFAVSGYCLANVKGTFFKWYGKRIYRIYPPVIIMTLIYMLLGAYNIQSKSLVEWFVYPTYYHFVASILVLYILFYFAMRSTWIKTHLSQVILAVALMWILVYAFLYNKSTYHIDSVYEPMIRFLFFESMLLGAWFREQGSKIQNVFKWRHVLGATAFFVIYFVSKLMFSKYEFLAKWQFLNQIIIFVLLYFVFRVFAGLDCKLNKLPALVKKAISFVSEMTLEIYIVQYVLIDVLKEISVFPVNWLVLTTAILGSAWILHKICQGFYYACEQLYKQIIRNK